MPHLVSTFLRNSSNTFEAQVANLKKATGTHRKPSPKPRDSALSSLRNSSEVSSVDDCPVDDVPAGDSQSQSRQHHHQSTMRTMTSLQRSSSAERRAHDDHHHRLSFGALHFGRSSRESHGNPNVVLSWTIESPPIVLHGDAESSTGALVSGLLYITIKEDAVPMESFKAALNIHVTQKRPYTAHCNDCINQYKQLQTWSFLQAPLTLTKGRHAFPFSVLLAGHLPASMDGQLVSVAYEFSAEATPKAGGGLPVKFEKTLDVKRSLPEPEQPHHSVRVFPPTNIKASVHFPQVIHPIGRNTMLIRIDGVTRLNANVNTLEFWKLKKLTWRLEETNKAVAPACERHMPHGPNEPDTEVKKGVLRSDTRIIGEKMLLSGWKSNYSGPEESYVEFELDYFLGKNSKFSCDTKSQDGTEVTHQLMVEMVVSQEWAPSAKPGIVTQTGVGRILRMHFNDILTERGGMGVSWDNEAPPIYQDVPPSPPSYLDELNASVITEHIEPLDAVNEPPPPF
ncbi:arrestin n-terminal domain containing protein [Grosmannia clavigera kw1407]|uniref:Arrestin n-terminal domain containing protein n=1 Tax=Grosmannia clavigera (strain kw1407 / UAMH 11150) TaxID=655863 RepID=F0XR20_GROCL|nr:arrestin n-terminal domain containing protein [Grosmannia clavigera kw1407]EFW99802.1 arrestin n-terminal domain containing protein [Grosmannia clavigera kw1407]